MNTHEQAGTPGGKNVVLLCRPPLARPRVCVGIMWWRRAHWKVISERPGRDKDCWRDSSLLLNQGIIGNSIMHLTQSWSSLGISSEILIQMEAQACPTSLASQFLATPRPLEIQFLPNHIIPTIWALPNLANSHRFLQHDTLDACILFPKVCESACCHCARAPYYY